MSDRGVAVNSKRKNKNQANPQEPSRQLEPYFDLQHQAPSHTSSADASALDNLFHRFVHKQTLDLEAENASLDNVAGVDNKAGLERLFGNLDVLKSQDEATPLYPTAQQTEQQHDDDALSRLLGGISLPADPTPSASHAAQLPSEKQNKLLAMLNKSPSPVLAPPQPDPQPIRPHQASLLAVLSPPPQPTVPVSSDHLTINAKPISLPTSPKPPSSSGNQERIKKQRALLEQITAGFDVDMPNPIPQGGYQPQNYHAFQSHPATAPGHVTEETAAYPHDRPQGASIAPPPPYEQTANIQQSPAKASYHSPKQHGHHPQQMSVEQNRLLSMLQTLPSKPHPGPTHSHPQQPLQYANPAGQAQGYRPVMHPGHPYNAIPTGLPFGGVIPPHVRDILAQQPSLPNAPQGAFYNVRPMGVPPSVPGGGHNPPVAFGMGVGYQGYPAQQGYQQGHLQHTRQPSNQAQSGPGHVGGPAVQQQLHPRPSPGGPDFHHPVPRPPNASGLLSMLNQK